MAVFNLVNYNKMLNNGITTLFSSFIIGYLYNLFIKIIPISISLEIDRCGIVISSIIISYIISMMYSNGIFNRLLEKLSIRRTSNEIIWTDLLDKEYAMQITIVMNNQKYIGYMGITEEYNQKPMMSLYCYKIVSTETNEIISDNSKQPNKIIVLDTSKAESIEITYCKHSIMYNAYKEFLKNSDKDDFCVDEN